MIDRILICIFLVNCAFVFTSSALYMIKKLNHGRAVFSSSALLSYTRTLLITGIIASAFLRFVTNPYTFPFITNNTKEIAFFFICGVGISLYLYQITNLVTLICHSPFKKRINKTFVVYSDQQHPCSFALLNKAYIIIPISMVENHKQLTLTLQHELQHCRQRDGLWNQLIAILGVISWWNPAFQFFKRQQTQIQEICCDHAVLNKYRISKKEYTLALLSAKNIERQSEKHNTIKLTQNPFVERIGQIFHGRTSNFDQLMDWMRILVLSLCVMTASVWSVNAAADVFMHRNLSNHETASIHSVIKVKK